MCELLSFCVTLVKVWFLSIVNLISSDVECPFYIRFVVLFSHKCWALSVVVLNLYRLESISAFSGVCKCSQVSMTMEGITTEHYFLQDS